MDASDEMRYLTAQVLFRTKKLQRALTQLERLVSLHPRPAYLPKAYLRAAEVLLNIGNEARAREYAA